MTDPRCSVCLLGACVHGEQSPSAEDVRLSDLETQLRCKDDAIRVLTDANARLQVELARALGTIQRGSR